MAFFALPVLLLRAKLREASEVRPQRVSGDKPDAIIMERAIRAEKGKWGELIREMKVDVALQNSREPRSVVHIASPGDPVSSAVADGFCRLAMTGQNGKAPRHVTQAPVIQQCPELSSALPSKILAAEPNEMSSLSKMREDILATPPPGRASRGVQEAFPGEGGETQTTWAGRTDRLAQ